MSEDLDFTQSTQDDKPKYIKKRGVYALRVIEYVYSKDIEGYNKTPFVRFRVHDEESLEETNLTFWMPTATDHEKRKKLKQKLIRDFLSNLGCSIDTLTGRDLLDCAIGKACKVALREKERIFYGKIDKKPMVVSEMEYYYSGTMDKTLNVNESKMIYPLNATMREKFERELASWRAEHEQTDAQGNPDFAGQMNPVEEEDDDLPF